MTYRSNHTRFEKIRISGWTMRVNPNFGKSSIGEFVPPAEHVDGVRGPFNRVDASEYARVFKCSVVFGGRCRNFYVKQFLYRSTWDFVKHIFRPSRARRAFSGSMILAEHQLGVPETVAFGERRFGPVCVSNFLVTRELNKADDLAACFKNSWQRQSPDVLCNKRRFIRTLGETVGRMHREGIFHGDMRAGNVFAKNTEAAWQFFFLDNERTRKFNKLPRRLRIKNLVQVNMLESGNISNTDRMRFFASYLKQNGDVRMRWKDLARKVISKTRRRLGHNLCAD